MLHRLLNLTRPLVILDCESTGPTPGYDRIVQIGMLTIQPDGTESTFKTLVNPQRPIPAEVTAIHGITDEMVKDALTWRVVGETVAREVRGADVAGYNVKFDLTMIEAECAREQIPLSPWNAIIDVKRLWQLIEPRTLADAVRRFAGRELGNAHDAMVDIIGTKDALAGVLSFYRPGLEDAARYDGSQSYDVQRLHDLQWPWPQDALDPRGKIVFRDGAARLTFGKHAGIPLHQVDPGYFSKFVLDMKNDFSPEVRAIARRVLAREIIGPRVVAEPEAE